LFQEAFTQQRTVIQQGRQGNATMMNGQDDDSELLSVSEFSQEDELSSSHGDRDSSFEHEENNKKKKKKSKEHEIGSKETKSVFRAKLMVYLVLIVSCVTASTLAYFFTRDQEEDDYRNDFKVYADEVKRVAKDVIQTKIDVGESLSIQITSYANDNGFLFPFVTLPDFERVSANLRHMANTDFISFISLVPREKKAEFENYTLYNNEWVQEGLEVQGLGDVDPGPIPSFIVDLVQMFGVARPDPNALENLYFAPTWQTGPAPFNASTLLSDVFVNPQLLPSIERILSEGTVQITPIFKIVIPNTAAGVELERPFEVPHSAMTNGIYDTLEGNGNLVGFVYTSVPWNDFFNGILSEGTGDIEVVVSENCGEAGDSKMTFVLDGEESYLKAFEDAHDPKFDSRRESTVLTNEEFEAGEDGRCRYELEIYPTNKLKNTYDSNEPLIYSIVVAMIFVFTTMVFLVYDWAVQRRQWMIIRAARKTQAIVSSLFPKNVQDRILKDVDDEVQREANKPLVTRGNRTKDQLQNFLKGKDGVAAAEEEAQMPTPGARSSKPIADLFPEATIIFADIVGFTAWSSTREPTQVFQLLETIYHVFDEIANRRRVFKVETVGDCYVAVAGLPEPRKDHAIVMARFARDCLIQFTSTVKAMVVELGPDTEELGVRIGLHSGPVTAGVLRGERARFQLFGDTVNTTARMESTGSPNKIHVSQETADLLTAAGKSQWLRTRRETVVAKGKGELQTYWLESTGEANTVTTSGESDTEDSKEENQNGIKPAAVVAPAPAVPSADKYNRLVAWNCDILAKLLTQIVARRESRRTVPDPVGEIRKLEEQYCSNRYVLSEVQEIVRLPKFEAESQRVDPWSVQLSEDVLSQLKDYVQTLAAMYRDNPFHNFEHASHVTMSVMKLLSRIVAPDVTNAPTDTDEALHDHTYGITSDPMTQFAVALSALIHDVDHPGVPNSQLIKEETSLAAVYRNKSIAEQNSVDLAWDLLMDDAYGDLRNTIYVTKTEFLRFRQLVVNIVLATDIMDKDLGALRKGRWNKAFSEQSTGNTEDDVNRKATIVMEHLIQASDVAHTMQHWHIYRKWNQRLFREMYEAFLQGRAEKDPSDNWYEGEKGFFDFYIIPLAKKLKDCGVFGVSSDEYLQYAVQNRKEWELKGAELVAEMLKSFRDQGLIPGGKAQEQPEQAPPPRQSSALSLNNKKEQQIV